MGQFWIILDLSLMGLQVFWVSKSDLVAMAVEVIIN